MNDTYTFQAEVGRYPVDNGWHLVRVPSKLSQPLEILADRGLIAVEATVGQSSWKTSLLPYGDGTHFIPLPVKIRKKAGVAFGDTITLSFALRER